MVDLVAIGHVTVDEIAGATRAGGAAYYAAVTAWRLGLRVGILTAHGPDFPIDALPPGIALVSLPSDRSTVYRVEGGTERRLTLLSRAPDIQEHHLPDEWRRAPM